MEIYFSFPEMKPMENCKISEISPKLAAI